MSHCPTCGAPTPGEVYCSHTCARQSHDQHHAAQQRRAGSNRKQAASSAARWEETATSLKRWLMGMVLGLILLSGLLWRWLATP